jgi:hypothetical protein
MPRAKAVKLSAEEREILARVDRLIDEGKEIPIDDLIASCNISFKVDPDRQRRALGRGGFGAYKCRHLSAFAARTGACKIETLKRAARWRAERPSMLYGNVRFAPESGQLTEHGGMSA